MYKNGSLSRMFCMARLLGLSYVKFVGKAPRIWKKKTAALERDSPLSFFSKWQATAIIFRFIRSSSLQNNGMVDYEMRGFSTQFAAYNAQLISFLLPFLLKRTLLSNPNKMRRVGGVCAVWLQTASPFSRSFTSLSVPCRRFNSLSTSLVYQKLWITVLCHWRSKEFHRSATKRQIIMKNEDKWSRVF